jgi:hypothetical protein
MNWHAALFAISGMAALVLLVLLLRYKILGAPKSAVWEYREDPAGGGSLVSAGAITAEERRAFPIAFAELQARHVPLAGDRFRLVEGKFERIP